jgi:hypothetical protein
MMLPLALVSVLVGSPVPAEAPPGALAPAPAPTPAPVELAPAPAPAPAQPAPGSSVVTVHTTTSPAGTTTSTVTVQESAGGSSITTTTTSTSTGWDEPTPAPVVVVTPTPVPHVHVSPPAPTWTPMRPTAYVPPDEATVRRTMRQHRRGAVGAFAVGSLGMGAAIGFQYMRIRGLQRCAAASETAALDCFDAGGMQLPFGYYSTVGMGMFVAGTAGAGAMLGNAAATRDVQLRGGDVRKRTGLKLLGVVVIGAAASWMIGANLQLGRHEAQCDGNAGCLLRYRPLRFAANDGAAVGIAAGAGMLGYALGYERQGRALMRLRAAPSISARHTGVAVSMEF